MFENLGAREIWQKPGAYELRAFTAALVSSRVRRLRQNSLMNEELNSSQLMKGVLFIHVPKCAGSSIEKALGVSGGGHTSVHFHQLCIARSTFKTLFKFSFVRDPFSRVYSVYRYLIFGGDRLPDWMKQEADRVFGKDVSFESFVKKVRDERMHLSHQMLRTASSLLCPSDSDEILVDFVGRFENLKTDFEVVRGRVEGSSELEVVNASAKPDLGEITSLPLSTKEMIREMYAKDFRVFGY